MRKTVTWIVLADGAHARILENEGPGKGLKVVADKLEGDTRHIGEMVTDRQGRTFDRMGEGRHGAEPHTDPKRVEEARFARSVAEAVKKGLDRNSFDRLVLVAAPRTLGDLRELIPKEAHDRIKAELPKDLTKVRMKDLPKHLDEVMVV